METTEITTGIIGTSSGIAYLAVNFTPYLQLAAICCTVICAVISTIGAAVKIARLFRKAKNGDISVDCALKGAAEIVEKTVEEIKKDGEKNV